jgi:hypothetical protein
MNCWKCKYYYGGCFDNKCELTGDENFFADGECILIDDNYKFLETENFYAWKKGENSDDFIKERKKSSPFSPEGAKLYRKKRKWN